MTLAELIPKTKPEASVSLWIPFLLPSFNDLEHARGRIAAAGRGHHRANAYNTTKRELQSMIVALASRTPKIRGARVLIACGWCEPNEKRDRDGIASGGRKILHDALAEGRKPTARSPGWPGAGVIHCDGAHCIAAQVDVYVATIVPGVWVRLYEVVP